MNSINKIFTRFLFCAIMATLFIVALPTHKAFAQASVLQWHENMSVNKGFSTAGISFNMNFSGGMHAQYNDGTGEAGMNITGMFTFAGDSLSMAVDCAASFTDTIKLCAHLTEGTIKVEEGGATSPGCVLDAALNGKVIHINGNNNADVGASLCVRMTPKNNFTKIEMHVKGYSHLGFPANGILGNASIKENFSLFVPKTICIINCN